MSTGWDVSENDVGKFVRGFNRLLNTEEAFTQVQATLDHERRPKRAGLTYSQLEPVTENTLELSDWLAITMLDVDTPPKAFRGIQLDAERRGAIEEGLSQVRDVPLAEASDDDLRNANRVYDWIRYENPSTKTTWGMGRARTSKLLARKRPNLVPIVDQRIDRWFDHPSRVWAPMREALRRAIRGDPRYFDALDGHLRRDELTRSVTVLRAIDIAAWELA